MKACFQTTPAGVERRAEEFSILNVIPVLFRAMFIILTDFIFKKIARIRRSQPHGTAGHTPRVAAGHNAIQTSESYTRRHPFDTRSHRFMPALSRHSRIVLTTLALSFLLKHVISHEMERCSSFSSNTTTRLPNQTSTRIINHRNPESRFLYAGVDEHLCMTPRLCPGTYAQRKFSFRLGQI